MGNSILAAERYTDRDLIESILSSFFIVDYGFIKNINEDNSVDVVHAKRLKTLDDKILSATITKRIEVLTLSAAGFALSVDYKKGDKVLLLGLKDFVPKTGDVTQATETTVYLHYTRETLKALPLCIFNEDAKVKINAKDGKLDVFTSNKLNLDGDDNGGVVIGPELKKQLGYLTTRVDTIINALKNSPTAAQDGGATYKAAIVSTLNTITNKEDFSNIESDKVMHGTGEN